MRRMVLALLLSILWASPSWAAFPQVQSCTGQQFSTETTAHAVTMPATVNSGDLLMVLISVWSTPQTNADPVIATPSGWTQLDYATDFTSSFGDTAQGVYVRIADGTEDGTTYDWVTTDTAEAATITCRIDSWEGTTNGYALQTTQATGISTAPDPPSLSPSWGSDDNLWFELVAMSDDAESCTVASTSYANIVNQASGSGSDANVSVCLARRENATGTEDPDAMTTDTLAVWLAWTFAIRPAAGGGGSTPKGPTLGVYP